LQNDNTWFYISKGLTFLQKRVLAAGVQGVRVNAVFKVGIWVIRKMHIARILILSLQKALSGM